MSFLEYRSFYSRIQNLKDVQSALQWDMEVMMPPAGREARSQQLSELSRIIHEYYTGEDFTRTIDSAKNELASSNNESSDSVLRKKRELELLEEKRDKSSKLTTEFVQKLTQATGVAQGAWEEARKKEDFSIFSEHLSLLVDLGRQQADFYGYNTEAYDALVDDYEKGVGATFLNNLFTNLKMNLIPIVDNSSFYNVTFPSISASQQEAFCKKLVGILGLSDSESRLDRSTHPFSTSLGPKDKRITTRYDERDPLSSVFGVMHEVGHSLYESGLSSIPEAPNPIAEFLSLGIHESQSRLWENQIGRSKEFWEHYYPLALKDWGVDEKQLPFSKLMQSIHSVEKTKIRVEADQVTYNLHIILRFEIERDLINGKVQVGELVDLWNSKMKDFFNLKIENPNEGILQDVHWCMAAFGYFPTYCLGNIYSAQLYDSFLKSHPEFPLQLKNTGSTNSLLEWLRNKIHLHGSYYTVEDLMEKATGEKPNSHYLIDHLQRVVETGQKL